MWLGHHFQGQKVEGQGHQATLLTAVLARQATAAVSVRTCWPWETAATLSSARRRKTPRRPQGEERGGAYRGGRPPTACSIKIVSFVPLLCYPVPIVWRIKVFKIFKGNKLYAWRHDMTPPLSSRRGRPSASRAAEQTQRSSSFPGPIRSHGHRCTRLTR